MTDTPIVAALRELLAKRLGGNGVDLKEILANHSDPIIRGLAQQLGAREIDAEAVEVAEDETDEPPERTPGPPEPLRERLARLRVENKRLAEINDTLAGALGACPLCWGDDPDCSECSGDGVPGSAPPRQALFVKYVLPALRRRKEERQRTATHGSITSKGR